MGEWVHELRRRLLSEVGVATSCVGAVVGNLKSQISNLTENGAPTNPE
jgi:hypothetical protein